jgi:hypothetical protein
MTLDRASSAQAATWLPELAGLLTELGDDSAATRPRDDALRMITERGMLVIDRAEHASISISSRGRFETVASTSDLPSQVDAIQYELHSGPGIDAAAEQTVLRADDRRADARWPVFGPRAAETTGVLSMLSLSMLSEDDDHRTGLNFYSSTPNAFTDQSRLIGLILAAHGALTLTRLHQRDRIENLTRALASNRNIGTAVGIVMASHKLTQAQAFDLLRVASQHGHRKLADVATEIVETGTLELPQR